MQLLYTHNTNHRKQQAAAAATEIRKIAKKKEKNGKKSIPDRKSTATPATDWMHTYLNEKNVLAAFVWEYRRSSGHSSFYSAQFTEHTYELYGWDLCEPMAQNKELLHAFFYYFVVSCSFFQLLSVVMRNARASI